MSGEEKKTAYSNYKIDFYIRKTVHQQSFSYVKIKEDDAKQCDTLEE